MRTAVLMLAFILGHHFYTLLLYIAVWLLAFFTYVAHRKAFIMLIVNR